MPVYKGCSINNETMLIAFGFAFIGIKVNIIVKYNLFPTKYPNMSIYFVKNKSYEHSLNILIILNRPRI